MGQQVLFEGAVEGGARPEARERMTLAVLEAWLQEEAPSPMWWEGFQFLRARGVRYRDAILATWLSLSTDDRGALSTREDLADLLGVSRASTYNWEKRRPQIRDWAEAVRIMRLRGARLAEVDERTFEAAVAMTGTATDRKLYYQRAGVWEEAARVAFGEREDPFEFEDVSDEELEAIEQALVEEAAGSGAQE